MTQRKLKKVTKAGKKAKEEEPRSGESIVKALGNKLEKRTQETSPQVKTTNTTYIGGYVYVRDSLQFMGHEEGRVRVVRGSGSPVYVYDYFVKDHLGNTRMVLTDEQKTDAYPVASLENATIATEKLYYTIPDGGTVNKNTVAGYPNDVYTNPNDYIQKLNGNNQKVGTSIVLRVMAGDKVNIRANSWYRLNGVTPGTAVNPINDIVAALMGGLTGNVGKGWLGPMVPSGYVPPGMADFLTRQSNAANSNSKPKAYLNYILFDEQLKPVVDTVNFNSNQTSGFDQVGASEEFKTHIITDKEVTRNGYLYIYVSNATQNVDVFFDNVQVTHTRGPLQSEDHYYAFGLRIASISSKSAGSLTNKRKFNAGSELQNEEFSDGSGLELYATPLRSLDPQLGRWWQIDCKPDHSQSLYASMGNNPILNNDPLGDTIVFPNASPNFKETFRAVAFDLFLKGGAASLTEIMSAKERVNVVELKGTNTSSFDPKTKTLEWNPQGGIITNNDVKLSPATILEHEADHANANRTDAKAQQARGKTIVPNYDNAEEKRVIQGSEQNAALALREIAPGEKTRADHSAKALIITKGPLTTQGKIIPLNVSQPLPEVVVTSKKKNK